MPEAVSLPQLAAMVSGETVYVPGCTAEPVAFSELLAGDPRLAANAQFVTSFAPGINPRNLGGEHRSMSVFLMQASFADAETEGKVRFRRLAYSEAQRFLASDACPIDTALLQVSPPDSRGRCSLGPTVEFTPTVLRKCARIIGVINPRIPSLPVGPGVSVDQMAAVSHSDSPPATYDAGPSNAVTAQIISHVVPLIPDGATIQLGLGKIPAHAALALAGRRGLRVHSGMISDWLIHLLDSSSLDTEPIVGGVAVGTPMLYERLPSIRNLQLEDVSVTHDAAKLAHVPRLHALNSGIEVDLSGAVNAEVLDGRFVSGPGGLPDFAGAACRQADGLSIIVLPAVNGRTMSGRIVAQLPDGITPTVSGTLVDVVVTEYGAADLRGLGPEARAAALVAIAHPMHRDELRRSFSARPRDRVVANAPNGPDLSEEA